MFVDDGKNYDTFACTISSTSKISPTLLSLPSKLQPECTLLKTADDIKYFITLRKKI